jgi:MFS family permease
MAPPYWLAERLGRDPGPWVMSVNAVVVAALAVVLLLLGLRVGATLRQSLAMALAIALGTLLLPYVVTGFSEPGVALGIALGLLGIQARRPTLVGAGAGLALLMRIDSVILVAPVLGVGAWLSAERSWRAALGFAAGMLPAVVVTAAYDTVRYGAPWRVGYQAQLFNHPILTGLYGLLLSPAAGLLFFVPLLPVALAGMPAAWRRTPLLAATSVALLLVRLPFYAAYAWWSAYWVWGPRYLVPAMPALAVGLLEVFRRWSHLRLPVRAAALALLALSAAVQLVGASVTYDRASMFAALLRAHPPVPGAGFAADATKPSTEAVFDRVDFDWSLFPITDEARDLTRGQHLASHWLAPTVQYPAVVALLGVAAVALATAILAARRPYDGPSTRLPTPRGRDR